MKEDDSDMHTPKAPLVRNNFSQEQLRTMLQLTDKTFDAFRESVLDRVSDFVHGHREKIGECLIGIRDQYVQVTFMQRTVRHDDVLQDACSNFEWDIAQEEQGSWPNVNTFLCPATSQENLEYMHAIAASGED